MKMKFFLLILFSFFILNSCSEPIPTGTISPADFERAINRHKDLQLIDVRTTEEFQGGYINGAINIDYFSEDFEVEIEKLDKSKPVAVYCGVGGRSESTLKVLQDLGYEEIYNLDRGITFWVENGLGIVKD